MADFAPLSLHSARDADSFAADLGACFVETGFAVIADHGLDQALIDRTLDHYRTFFAWPAQRKQRFHVPGGGGQRGYTPFGVETAKGAHHHDLKEFWHIGRELPEAERQRSGMPANLWIDDIAGMHGDSLALFAAFDQLGVQLLAAIARFLGLAPDWFAPHVSRGNSILRILHYPPVPDSVPNVRAGAHEDINVITLLLGAEEGGLEVLHRSGQWLAINPPPGALVVNIGDMLQRLTNHRLPSTTHRVTNPKPERARHARFSMPFFLHFNSDFLVQTLPECIDATHPDRYPVPITADDYLQQRLREIRLA